MVHHITSEFHWYLDSFGENVPWAILHGKVEDKSAKLASIKRKFIKSKDDYLNRFRLLKARCFTEVLEHELVEMTAGSLNYSIRKKLDTQYLRDMAQLTDRVWQVECLKAEKAKANKNNRKDRIAYVELGDDEPETYGDQVDFDEGEIGLDELK